MNKFGNPLMVKGNKLALKRRPSNKPEIARMLEQFVPDVIGVIEQKFKEGDDVDKWLLVKELLPYLFARKAPMQVTPDPVQKPGEIKDLNEYLLARARRRVDSAS